MKPTYLLSLVAAASSLLAPALALASSHREAPAISRDPVADSTDLWAWVTDAGTPQATLRVVASYNPLEEPSGGPNFNSFGDDMIYEVHVARGDNSLESVLTWRFEFKTTAFPEVKPDDFNAGPGGGKEFFSQLSGAQQSYEITEFKAGSPKKGSLIGTGKVAPPNIGPRTNQVAYGLKGTTKDDYEAYAQTFITTAGLGKAWAGPRDDGFYVDLGGVFDLANLRAKGEAQDGVAGFNCHTIAFNIPVSSLPAAVGNKDPKNADLIGVWTSASRRKLRVLRKDGTEDNDGPWVQVSRLGLPLINEAVIGLQDKDKYNRTHPKDDVANFGAYFLNPVIVRDAKAVGIYTALKVDDATVDKLSGKGGPRTDILDVINLKANGFTIPIAPGKTGDVLRVDLKTNSSVDSFPNGRILPGGSDQEADVTDILLTVLLASNSGIKVKDGVDRNDAKYLATIPYLATPWTGYHEGHGKPTP